MQYFLALFVIFVLFSSTSNAVELELTDKPLTVNITQGPIFRTSETPVYQKKEDVTKEILLLPYDKAFGEPQYDLSSGKPRNAPIRIDQGGKTKDGYFVTQTKVVAVKQKNSISVVFTSPLCANKQNENDRQLILRNIKEAAIRSYDTSRIFIVRCQ
ncbi:hypothetical protein PPL_12552 [Heterostelium album PN500]|uniref:Uncharacterized protein n=1 Tax=Heterostelium pallidum (strain ATCC 26659 / Pp 5 / PN500) TaxID=670386 RepID=D3BMX9_HETP5|nr:hypothetical protein PPL_12552 [Heterostelium album PN500]EFA77341.1 hypothetical protein PPL_12552 [Heterostelium album PN500]|eukprot:XP_020429470.1 hypothetical protein PPL_12552 [Heterostelium album PN500]